MGFNSAFKGLIKSVNIELQICRV